MCNFSQRIGVGLWLTLLAAAPAFGAGADWPRWRGPDLNGISKETGWTTQWPAGGPKKLWSAQVGLGFASFTISQGRVFTTGHANNQDTVFCFDAEKGDVLWKHSYPHPIDAKYYEGGTSATPTVDGPKVYASSRRGHLFCLEAATGKVVWSKHLGTDYGMAMPEWGFAGSPLVMGELLILNAGTAGLALNKQTGAVVWQNGQAAAGYATAVPFNDGQPRVAIFGAQALHALDLATGKPVWQYPWKTQYGVNAADPIFAGQRVFVSSSYGKGCGLIEFKGGAATKVYENKLMKNHFNSCVLLDGFLYGCTGEAGQASYLICMELNTGAIRWQERSVGLGSVMAADGKLIVLGEKGELIIARANPQKFDPLARAQVLGGKCWTVPVLSHGRIFCRNAPGQVVCLDVRP